MPGMSRRGKHSPHYNFIWDALDQIRFESALATQLLAGLDALPLPDDSLTRLAVCHSMVSGIVLQVVRRLRPDLLAEVSLPARARYNDALLPPAVRERVLFLLVDLLKSDAGRVRCLREDGEQRLALAITLVETAVAEIGQHVLDQPIAHAYAVTHTLNLVSGYLRAHAARDFSDKTCARASRDILYLIVRGISPHYLAAPAKGRRRVDR